MKISDLSGISHVFFKYSILSNRLMEDIVGDIDDRDIRVVSVGPSAMIIENKYLVIDNHFCVISAKEMYGGENPDYKDNNRPIEDSMISVTVSRRDDASYLITNHNAIPYRFSQVKSEIYSIELYLDKEDYLEWSISR